MAALPFSLLGSLTAAGNYLNKGGKVRDEPQLRQRIAANEMPNGTNVYENQRFREARNIEQKLVDRNFKKSFDPARSNVVPRFYNQLYAPFEPHAIKEYNVNLQNQKREVETLRRDNTFGGPGGPGDPRVPKLTGNPGGLNQLDQEVVNVNQFPVPPGSVDAVTRKNTNGSFAEQQGSTLMNPNISFDNVQTDIFYYPKPRSDWKSRAKAYSYDTDAHANRFGGAQNRYVNTDQPPVDRLKRSVGGWQNVTGNHPVQVPRTTHWEPTQERYIGLPSTRSTKVPPTMVTSEVKRLQDLKGYGSSNYGNFTDYSNYRNTGRNDKTSDSQHNLYVPRPMDSAAGSSGSASTGPGVSLGGSGITSKPLKDSFTATTENDGFNQAGGDKLEGFNPTISGPQHNQTIHTHNNMVPFFGGSVKQSIRPAAHQRRLEYFTGQVDDVTAYHNTHKKEIPSMFHPTMGQSYIYGTPNLGDYGKDRFVPSRKQGNVSPVEKVYVGPGLNIKYGVKGTDGFHQTYRPTPKNIDQLRVNPRKTYLGRTVAGKELVQNRGTLGKVYKNRPDRFYLNDKDRWFKTTGAVTKTKARENFAVDFGRTTREDTTTDYYGPIGSSGRESTYAVPKVKHTDRQNFNQAEPREANRQGRWNAEYDYGRTGQFGTNSDGSKHTTLASCYNGEKCDKELAKIGGFWARTQEREDTEATKGQIRHNVVGSSWGGGGGGQGQKVYDPKDVARTTIRNTTYQARSHGNVRQAGHTGGQVYDPNDTARTTIRNTTEQTRGFGNVRQGGHTGGKVHDPNDTAKTTIRNTVEQTRGFGNVRQGGHTGGQVYDPNDVAKTTVRNTTEQTRGFGNVRQAGHTGHQTYDPNDTARTTIRNTTEQTRSFGNVGQGKHTGHKTYDPNDVARTTIRNTTHQTRTFGNANALDGTEAPRNYEDMYNAEIDARKEVTLTDRVPTQQGVKNAVGATNINMTIKHRDGFDSSMRGVNGNRVYNIIRDQNMCGELSGGVLKTEVEGIRQPEDYLVNQFRENPYSKPLSSVAAY